MHTLYLASRLEWFLKLCFYEESLSDILGEGTNKNREVTTGKCCHGNKPKACSLINQLMESQKHY